MGGEAPGKPSREEKGNPSGAGDWTRVDGDDVGTWRDSDLLTSKTRLTLRKLLEQRKTDHLNSAFCALLSQPPETWFLHNVKARGTRAHAYYGTSSLAARHLSRSTSTITTLPCGLYHGGRVVLQQNKDLCDQLFEPFASPLSETFHSNLHTDKSIFYTSDA